MASFADKSILEVTVAEWTAYLEGSPSIDGVRLKLRKKLSKATSMTWSEALDVALCFGWIDGQSARFDDDYTLQSFTPRRKNSPWSQINRDPVARLIAEGKMRSGGLAEIERAKADGRWGAAYSMTNLTTPPDLQTALDSNPASAEFHVGLTKSVRFQIYTRLASIKTPSVRAGRIRDIVEKGAAWRYADRDAAVRRRMKKLERRSS